MTKILALLLAFSAHAQAAEKIDLQWSVCDASPEAVLAKIGNPDADVSHAIITYYDDENPVFIQDGVTFRVKGDKDSPETSVKIRFDGVRDVPEATCEWDRYGHEDRYTCEVTGQSDGSQIWSTAQLDFLSARYRESNLNSLKAFGPFTNRKWKFKHKDNKVTFDTVDTREAGHIMEFSVKVPYGDRDDVYENVSHWLDKNGVVLCDHQESKTARLFRALGLLK